ncbi:Alpha/Beta hydrolase protein [Hyaloraphidium curvatum]|nr:Alpha/Beta hydrolase protein [Hyaloraphidium curvatum]
MPTASNAAVNLVYEVHEPAPGAPPLGALLLLPGLACSLALWDPAFLGRLTQSGFRVVAMNNRGAGGSTRPAGKWTLGEMARDCAAVLDAAGERRAAVLGHSMGGMVAMRFACDFPGRVSSLLVLGAGAGAKYAKSPGAALAGYFLALQACSWLHPWASWASSSAGAWVRDAERGTIQKMFAAISVSSANPGGAAANAGELWARHWERAGDGPALSEGQVWATYVDLLEDVRKLSCPAAVVCGTEDCFQPKEAIEALHGAIPGSELVWLEGYNHWYPPDVWVRIAEIAARTAERGR